ncbi:MAG TPA: ABC transporter substrate-binding protein [Methylomirabilota bacterium]|jgi:NitT/TauT family transport system substrate-binding protein|nr:ABC transporter substrate-binding protein [Methylomirabilota bacterium]
MRGFALLVGASLALAAGTMEASAAERIRASYGSISGSTVPIWVTKEAGFFERYGLEVELSFIEGGAKAMAALVAGDVPIAQVGGSHVVSSHVAGSGVVILAGVVNLLEYKIIVAKEIIRPQQLRGKKAAVATIGGSGYLAMQVALERWGMAPDKDVALLQIGSQPARLQALMAGGVDAAVLSLPATIRAQKAGFRALLDLSAEAIEYQQLTLATTRAFIQARPETVRRFLRAYVEGIAFLKTNKEESLKIIAKYFRSGERDELEAAYNEYALKIIQRKPYPTLKGLQFVMDELAPKNPKIGSAKPEQFVELRFLKELDESGFIDRLYSDQGR